MRLTWALAGLLVAAPVLAGEPGPLGPPVRLTAGGQPINVERGHAAPFLGDFFGDGKPALLVGQFGDGKLRIYPNAGTAAAPRFDGFSYFSGRVPVG